MIWGALLTLFNTVLALNMLRIVEALRKRGDRRWVHWTLIICCIAGAGLTRLLLLALTEIAHALT